LPFDFLTHVYVIEQGAPGGVVVTEDTGKPVKDVPFLCHKDELILRRRTQTLSPYGEPILNDISVKELVSQDASVSPSPTVCVQQADLLRISDHCTTILHLDRPLLRSRPVKRCG
jgi:hypothetical protein